MNGFESENLALQKQSRKQELNKIWLSKHRQINYIKVSQLQQ